MLCNKGSHICKSTDTGQPVHATQADLGRLIDCMVAKTVLTLFQLYCGGHCTYPCFSYVLTSTQYYFQATGCFPT